ncbi:hypothetical protein [Stackebrandtia soli]|uniref:hypothetical protein n=1 Tax=Stackebrandtia soli TaxID=1892856 RepID=UPI0039E9ABAE
MTPTVPLVGDALDAYAFRVAAAIGSVMTLTRIETDGGVRIHARDDDALIVLQYAVVSAGPARTSIPAWSITVTTPGEPATVANSGCLADSPDHVASLVITLVRQTRAEALNTLHDDITNPDA